MRDNLLIKWWSRLSVIIFALAIMHSIILSLLPKFYKTSLVLYVDLINLWLLSGAAIVMIRNITNIEIENIIIIVSKLAFVGVLFIAISPFTSNTNQAILNNYLPMIDNLCFILGISLFLIAILLISLLTITNIGSQLFLCITLSFILSYQKLGAEIIYPMDLHGFYEMLFCSTGYGLYLLSLYTMNQVMLAAISHENISFPRINIIVKFVYIKVAGALILLHFIFNIDSAEFIMSATHYIKYSGGIIGSMMTISIIAELVRSPVERCVHILSLILLLIGSIIDIFIFETNIVISPHYYYSLAGISLSLMSYIYFLLEIRDNLLKQAKIQAIIYFTGQILYMTGEILVRKFNIFSSLDNIGKILITISGLIFVVICTRTICQNPKLKRGYRASV